MDCLVVSPATHPVIQKLQFTNGSTASPILLGGLPFQICKNRFGLISIFPECPRSIDAEISDDDDDNWFNGPSTSDQEQASDCEESDCTDLAVKIPYDPLFTKAPLLFQNEFKVGMKMEGCDPSSLERWCVLSVSKVRGHRLKLHIDGYSSRYDFWANAFSPFIKCVGFCARSSRPLMPPRGFYSDSFNWQSYLAMTVCEAAPADIFHQYLLPPSNLRPSSHYITKGMHLFAESTGQQLTDNPKVLCEVIDIHDDWLLLISPVHQRNGLDKQLWVTLDSPFISAVNESTDSPLVLPIHAFQPRKPFPFHVGYGLEMVDPKQSSRLRHALVIDVVGPRIMVELSDNCGIVLPDDSWNIYPEGYCRLMGFPMLLSYRKGKMVAVDVKPITPLPDRLISANANVCVVDLQMEDDDDISCGPPQPPRMSMFADTAEHMMTCSPVQPICTSTTTELSDTFMQPYPPSENGTTTAFQCFPIKISELEAEVAVGPTTEEQYENEITTSFEDSVGEPFGTNDENDYSSDCTYSDSGAIEPISPANWQIRLLPSYEVSKSVPFWTCDNVANFISGLPGCFQVHAQPFLAENIDGEAFLLLSQSDLVEHLGLKLGPAVKIFSMIMYCRRILGQGAF